MCGRGSEEMATADPGTMFSMLAGEMEAGAGLLLARAGPQLRVEPDGGGGQRDERVQAVPRAAHGGTRGRGSYF